MKRQEAKDEGAIGALLKYLKGCHDASLRRVSFVKPRNLDEDGNLVYLDENFSRCDIEMELLLCSFVCPLPQQVVTLYFEGVQSFRFFQEPGQDYSDIYEVDFRKVGDETFEFVFRIRHAETMIEILSLVCRSVVCTEHER